MTFEEWWESAEMQDSRMGLAWEAWQAAIAAERKRCAVACDEIEARWREQAESHDLAADHGRRDGAMWCGDAIRKQEVSD